MRHTTAFAGLMALASAAGANAADIPQLSPSLRFEVSGKVSPRCSLTNAAPGGSVRFENAVSATTNTARVDTATLPFQVACNTPMVVQMQSSQGGLVNPVTTRDQDFTSSISYTAQLSLPALSNYLSCTSANMKAVQGCITLVKDEITEGEGSVKVTLNPENRLLVQGTYADQVTITLRPVLGGNASGT